MRIGGSLFVIAVGAILKWAITGHVSDVNLSTIGIILMVVGVVGLVASLAWSFSRRRTDVVQQNTGAYYDAAGRPVAGPSGRTTYVEPRE